MYTDSYSEEITKKLAKLKKKDPNHFEIVDTLRNSDCANSLLQLVSKQSEFLACSRTRHGLQPVVLDKKMKWILANPEHRFKDLHYGMKGISRVHIGHFVLVFRIDHIKRTVSFEDYDHHDGIYG